LVYNIKAAQKTGGFYYNFQNKKDMKISLVIIMFFLLFFSPLTGQVPDSAKFKSLRPSDFHTAFLKEDTAFLIDVREFFEFRKSRLDGSVNIPSSTNLKIAADTIGKEYPLFLYCTSGYRSKRVAGSLYDKGFRKLYSLEGGIVAWRREGFPVERKRIKKGHK
jgi:thioredoxin 1